jgi:hypothetical protein
LGAVQEDFAGFATNTLQPADPNLIRLFRDYLYQHGVYITHGKDIKRVEALVSLFNEEIQRSWPKDELDEMIARNKLTSKHAQRQTPGTATSQGQTPASTTPAPPKDQTQPPILITGSPEPARTITGQPSQQPAVVQTEFTESCAKKITELSKLYNDDKKYSGELYDILKTKLKIFEDLCHKVFLPESMYHFAFSIMLKGRASQFYYDRLSGKYYTYDRLTQETRAHFETEENRQLYLSEWRETTLPIIITQHKNKNRLEQLEILFDRLQIVQRGLSEVYQEDYSLRDQILSACRGIEECNMALFKPAPTWEGVCNDLRAAIGATLRTRGSRENGVYLTQRGDDDDDDQAHPTTFITDRKFGGKGYFYRKGGRGNPMSRYPGRRPSHSSPPFRRTKKCFYCGKVGCWSTKHTLGERQQAFNRYKSSAYHMSMPTVGTYQTFLAEYEGTPIRRSSP